jgi:hypothetical protein
MAVFTGERTTMGEQQNIVQRFYDGFGEGDLDASDRGVRG